MPPRMTDDLRVDACRRAGQHTRTRWVRERQGLGWDADTGEYLKDCICYCNASCGLYLHNPECAVIMGPLWESSQEGFM